MFRKLSALTLATALLSAPALADEVAYYREGQALNPVDVATILGGKAPARVKMRSIHLLGDAPAVAAMPAEPALPAAQAAQTVQAAQTMPAAAPAQALSLQVRFSFGSAEIAEVARPQLDALAAGIRMLPADRAVLVEGHTDAVGGDAYNRELSHRRAQAVKRYLSVAHGIDPDRLHTAGFGEGRTIAGIDPAAAENRRVQFRGL
ncbi:MAG: OmpA family protein [Burkholderiales bacterium]|nr:OmpA family protein [Burkholderiales bacterium]